MKIGSLEAQPGSKVYGSLVSGQTHGGFDVHIPLHIIAGQQPGPTLVVQSGISGLEIEPAMILPRLVQELQPAALRGTLVVIPLLNTSGFEFEQENAVWDNKDLNTLGRGKADGTVSERLIHLYYHEVLARADALLDIHTGAQWGYFRYAGVYDVGAVDRGRALAEALGLPHVLLGQPADGSMAYAAAQDGKTVVTAWIGGGPGLRDYREEDMTRIRRAVLNAARHLGMLADDLEDGDDPVTTFKRGVVVGLPDARGLTFMDKRKRGTRVQTGEKIGYVRHPFTGEVVHHITAPQAGVVLHAGVVWPMAPEGALLAIIGESVDS